MPTSEGIVVRGHEIPPRELVWRFSRSSGPGGQGVNTTDSRVTLQFDLASTTALPSYLRDRAARRLASRLVDGHVVVTASEHRSQLQNRAAAERRLVAILDGATAPPPRARRATAPTAGSRERRLAGKRLRGQVKQGRGRVDPRRGSD